MIYENILAIYAPEEVADSFVKKEKADRTSFLDTVERLKILRDSDPEAFSEMIEAMELIQGEKQIDYVPYNKYVEYGIEQNEVIVKAMERQQRILAIVHSNKDISTLNEAVNSL